MVAVRGRSDADDCRAGMAVIRRRRDAGRGKRTQQHHGCDKHVDHQAHRIVPSQGDPCFSGAIMVKFAFPVNERALVSTRKLS